jgi:hypothetical protein
MGTAIWCEAGSPIERAAFHRSRLEPASRLRPKDCDPAAIGETIGR